MLGGANFWFSVPIASPHSSFVEYEVAVMTHSDLFQSSCSESDSKPILKQSPCEFILFLIADDASGWQEETACEKIEEASFFITSG